MNLKAITISISLILAMITGGLGIKCINTSSKTNNVLESAEENIVENKSVEDEQIPINDETTSEMEILNNAISNELTEKENIVQEVSKVQEEKKEQKKTESNKQIQVEQNKQKQEQVIVEQPKQVVETPKQEPKPKEVTPDDLEYWCVGGGKHHVAGDGANEHGYYSTWDEAYNAFLNYTANWSSSQYKVSRCSCGLFYFWAIQ